MVSFNMRIFLVLLLLIFNLQSLTNAEDISEFEIEGISIGDSLLDHLSKDRIDKLPAEYYPKSDKFYVVDGNFQNSELYDGFQVGLKKNDYTIYGITAGIFFDDMKNCLTHKNKVEEEISDMFDNLEKYSSKGKHDADPNGNSYMHQTQYSFSKGGVIAIECLDWSDEITNKYNWQDNFSISFYSKEYEYFVRYEAY
tara:strand:+ start:398 stop:988 length:591 start_codon:yes stop_codon:yes gene_type:complete